jgi:hypothetical protein
VAANTATANRDETIERFVHVDAVEMFISALDVIDGEMMFPRSVLHGESGEVNLGAGRLGDELWPKEADYDSHEAVIARSRSSAVVARVFAALASDEGRSYCAMQAEHHANFAHGRSASDVKGGDDA